MRSCTPPGTRPWVATLRSRPGSARQVPRGRPCGCRCTMRAVCRPQTAASSRQFVQQAVGCGACARHGAADGSMPLSRASAAGVGRRGRSCAHAAALSAHHAVHRPRGDSLRLSHDGIAPHSALHSLTAPPPLVHPLLPVATCARNVDFLVNRLVVLSVI